MCEEDGAAKQLRQRLVSKEAFQELQVAAKSEPATAPRQSKHGCAILTCHACGKILAKELKKCPHCGATRKPTKEEQFASNAWGFGCLISVLIFILIPTGIHSCSDKSTSSSSSYTSPSVRERKIREMSDESGIPMEEIRKNFELPSMRGYSEERKETIIREAIKLDAAVKQHEKERGY